MFPDYSSVPADYRPSATVYEQRHFVGEPRVYGHYSGAGSAPRLAFEPEPSLGSDVPTVVPKELLAAATNHLNATRAQLGEALGVGRQRIYQLLDGERPGADTLSRLLRLGQWADRWHELHARPMGMILPKPAQLLEAFWTELAKPVPDATAIMATMDQLAERHEAFEQRATRQTQLRASTEPGLIGLLPPRGFYADDAEA
jgi:hypothetical protein